MKLHVSACNGHHQVSTTIKKGLYIFLIVVETWWWQLQAETCSFIIRIQHISKQVVLFDYAFHPLIGLHISYY